MNTLTISELHAVQTADVPPVAVVMPNPPQHAQKHEQELTQEQTQANATDAAQRFAKADAPTQAVQADVLTASDADHASHANQADQADEADAPTVVEPDVPAMLRFIPLSALRLSRRNVRKTSTAPLEPLAESIARVGLLQNLIVIADGQDYGVVGGRRRLLALRLLAMQKRLAKDQTIPCLHVPDDSAVTVSLTENVQREAMHPADQFEAFKALVDEGRPIEDIAADFGVTPLVVQRRLRLAKVSPRLLAAYRQDDVTLEQLMALAITDDQTAQETAFFEAPEWQRSAEHLRRRLTECEVDAPRSPLARFVGLDAYEAAGGGIRRDLFADEDSGVYLTDAGTSNRIPRQEGIDCALRVGELPASSLVARPVGLLRLINCASPAYVTRHGIPKTPADLPQHLVVNYASSGSGRAASWEWKEQEEIRTLTMPARVTANNAETYIACCLAGLGLIQIPVFDVREHLKMGELVEVLTDWPAPSMPMHIVYPHRHDRLPRPCGRKPPLCYRRTDELSSVA